MNSPIESAVLRVDLAGIKAYLLSRKGQALKIQGSCLFPICTLSISSRVNRSPDRS
jgi:hypothetical protein